MIWLLDELVSVINMSRRAFVQDRLMVYYKVSLPFLSNGQAAHEYFLHENGSKRIFGLHGTGSFGLPLNSSSTARAYIGDGYSPLTMGLEPLYISGSIDHSQSQKCFLSDTIKIVTVLQGTRTRHGSSN